MNKIRFFLPLLAIMFAIGASAFSLADSEVKPVLVQKWYDFVGDDPNDPADYQVHSGAPPSCNSGSSRCAVKAVQDQSLPGDLPDLNDASIEIRNRP